MAAEEAPAEEADPTTGRDDGNNREIRAMAACACLSRLVSGFVLQPVRGPLRACVPASWSRPDADVPNGFRKRPSRKQHARPRKGTSVSEIDLVSTVRLGRGCCPTP